MVQTTGFAGGVFSAEVPGGRAMATLRGQAGRLVAQTADGVTVDVNLGECDVELGGASGRMWLVHTPGRQVTVYSEAPGFDRALVAWGGPHLAQRVAQVLTQQKTSTQRLRLAFVAALGVLALVAWGIWEGVGASVPWVVEQIPLSVDQTLGELGEASMAGKGSTLADPVVTAAIQTMVTRLEPHASIKGLEFDVKVVESSTVNAVCFPGGRILVFTGLIKKAATAEQLAGVLAHEMAHATHRHGVRQVLRMVGLSTAVQVALGDVGGLVAAASELAKMGVLTKYSRELETEADTEGGRMMKAAGLNPGALADFLEQMEKDEPGMPEALSWLSSHPESLERAALLRSLGKPAPDSAPLKVDWAAVQKRAAGKDTAVDIPPAVPATEK
jgi:Zn-dependent protease with chaperone function